MFHDVYFEFVLEWEAIIAFSGTECAWLTEKFVWNALSGDSLCLNVMDGFVNVIQRGIVANLIDTLNTFDKVLA